MRIIAMAHSLVGRSCITWGKGDHFHWSRSWKPKITMAVSAGVHCCKKLTKKIAEEPPPPTQEPSLAPNGENRCHNHTTAFLPLDIAFASCAAHAVTSGDSTRTPQVCPSHHDHIGSLWVPEVHITHIRLPCSKDHEYNKSSSFLHWQHVSPWSPANSCSVFPKLRNVWCLR